MFKKLLSAATAFTLTSGVVLPGLFSGADDARVFAEESMELYVDQVTAEPGEEGVPIKVNVRGNTGISGIGARIEFNTEKSQWDAPSPLSIQLEDDGKTPIWDKGDLLRFWETDEKGVSTIAANLSQDDCDIVGASATGIELCIDDGSFYTVYFDVPQDAQPGDVYSLNLVVVDLLGPKEAFSSSHRELVEGTDFTVVNGSITISGDAVTTETASTETTTQTTPAESDMMQLYVDRVTAAPGEEGVPIKVNVRGNTGISGIGARIEFNTEKSQWDAPSPLSIQLEDDGKTPIWDKGDLLRFWESYASGISTISTNFAREDCDVVGASATGLDEYTGDGSFYTVYFDIPWDAQPGDVYPLNLVVVDLLGPKEEDSSSRQDLIEGTDFTVANGSITIAGEAVTTTESTTTATETTTTTEPVDTFGYCGAAGNEENVTWNFDPDTGELVISGSGDMANYYSDSPPWMNKDVNKATVGQGITSIGAGTFRYCSELVSVQIPNSVTGIESEAFSECTSLTSVTIPNSVIWIENDAFRYCKNLTSVVIPDSVTKIGYDAFNGCTALTSVIFPDSVTEIGYDAFYGCTALTSVTIPGSVKFIEVESFGGCTALTSVTVLNGVTTIGSSAFEGCSNLTSVMLPESITGIGEYAFEGTAWLNSKLAQSPLAIVNGVLFDVDVSAIEGDFVIPSDVTSIGDGALSGCNRMTSVEIPDGVTYIGAGAFWGCSLLASVKIPDGVTGIREGAFYDCDSLTSIVIPDNVIGIELDAFADCNGLVSVVIGRHVEYILYGAFSHCENLSEIHFKSPDCWIGAEEFEYGYTICNYDTSGVGTYNGIIYGYENSTAQAYAEQWGYTFQSLGTAPGTIPSTPGDFGDVDGTGNITIDDATMTLQVYTNQMLHVDAGVTDDVMKAMDLDEDGAVTIDDATYILAYYTAESVTHTPMTWYEITGNPNAPGAPE